MKLDLMSWKSNPQPADGAWGTMLLAEGLPQGEAPENWVFSHPEKVAGIARAYAEAGSRIILTNTFGGNSIKLEHSGNVEKMAEINREAARLTRQAGGGEYLTAGDIGPTGKMVFMGEVSPETVEDSYARQAEALKEGGAELFVMETFTDLIEMEAALRGILNGGAGSPVICSMTYDPMDDGSYRTVMGHSPADAVKVLEDTGASAIGANCGTGIEAYVGLAKELVSLTDLPVWIKANAGLPLLEGTKVVYPMTPAEYSLHVPALLEAGVAVVGGCCGTTPDHIRKIVEKISDFQGRGN